MARIEHSYRWAKGWYLIRRRSNNFLASQWSSGIVLLVFTAVALFLANNAATRDIYHHILGTDFGFNFGKIGFSLSIEQWINEALMAILFFVVGLEIKREIVAGQLASIKQAALPVAAALGGMIVPALIYLTLNVGTEYEPG